MNTKLIPKYERILTKYNNFATAYPNLRLDFNYLAITEIIETSTPKELAKLNVTQLTNIVYGRLMENKK